MHGLKTQGAGFLKNQAESIFKPFSQLGDSNTKKQAAQGLWLAICSEFISMMGGEISVESEEKKEANLHFH